MVLSGLRPQKISVSELGEFKVRLGRQYKLTQFGLTPPNNTSESAIQNGVLAYDYVALEQKTMGISGTGDTREPKHHTKSLMQAHL
jgi:hypothetical protein